MNSDFLYVLQNNILLLIVLLIASTDIPVTLVRKLETKINLGYFILEHSYLIFVFLLTLAYLVDSSYNPFLYFKF